MFMSLIFLGSYVTYFSRELCHLFFSGVRSEHDAHMNVHLFHFLNPENQITAYIDDVRTAWQIRVLWKWK